MSGTAISVRGIGKRYRLSHDREPYARLTESLSNAIRHPLRRRSNDDDFWALKDVSFDVPEGEVVGIIGRNGAGKSTLLKILSRITEPTEGEAVLTGRVGSLLEVGTGFHPELTGRENIFLSGSILGMRRAEIRRRFDEIVEFAEVSRFLDTPVKRYSSGMQVRLGFAVAAHLEPDVLIVDEVLAVGDAAFQRKSLGRMEAVSKEGRTVLFVSHSMAAVEALCGSAILLDEGHVVSRGPTHEVVADYVRRADAAPPEQLEERADRRGTGALRVLEVTANIRTGGPSELRLRYEAASELRNVAVAVGIFSMRGEGVLYLSSDISGNQFDAVPANGALVCRFDVGSLLPGRYSLNTFCTVGGVIADWVTDAVAIEVAEGDFYGTGRLPPAGYGHVVVPYQWMCEE